MASSCVNNAPHPLFSSPRLSFTHNTGSDPDPITLSPDLDQKDFIDFEFHLDEPVPIIPADDLFSDGKLVPLHLTPIKILDPDPTSKQPETPRKQPVITGSGSDLFAVSPKAPTCSSRWGELLRRKRQQQQQKHHLQNSDPGSKYPNPKSIDHFLNLNSRSGSESLPLLKDSIPQPPASISTRHSVSGPEPDISSLDAENKPNQNPILLNRNPPKHRARSGTVPARKPVEPVAAAATDSPRMNASGKVVFQGLGRSSSSPSTFNGATRVKSYRGMERSYSANVRVAPVLNVPVCSLRGGSKSFRFGQLFSGSGANPKGKN